MAKTTAFDSIARKAALAEQKVFLDSMNRAITPSLDSIARRAAEREQKLLLDSLNRAITPALVSQKAALESIKRQLSSSPTLFDPLTSYRATIEKIMRELSIQFRVSFANSLSASHINPAESLIEQLRTIQREVIDNLDKLMQPVIPPEKVLSDLSQSLDRFRLNIAPDVLIDIRKSFSELHSAPALAAFETIRKLGLRIHPEFSEYITEAAEAIDEGSIKQLETDYLTTHQDRLSPEQNRLMLYLTILDILLTILTVLIGFYLAVQSGKPIKIDPAQIEMLRRYPAVSITILQFFGDGLKVYYEVQRSTDLKVKPRYDSITITRLKPGARVRLIESKHKWIYIEYRDQADDLLLKGWANKKYLKRYETQAQE